MSDAEQIMSMVWGRIIGEVRKMRDEKYTLERIGTTLGVAKPTVQRWLENDAGGEKTAFIDILRYLKALNLDLKELLYGDEEAAEAAAKDSALSVELQSVNAELESTGAERQRLALDLVDAQKELLTAKQKIIDLQEKVIGLEKLNADIADKARKAIIAAAASSKKAAAPTAAPAASVVTPPPPPGKRRLDPSMFPDLPPIHLQHSK